MKRQIAGTAAQTALLLACLAARFSIHDRKSLESYASIPHLGWWARERAVAARHRHHDHGWLRNAGVILRA